MNKGTHNQTRLLNYKKYILVVCILCVCGVIIHFQLRKSREVREASLKAEVGLRIYKSIMAELAGVGKQLHPEAHLFYPDSRVHRTSTQYFNQLITNKFISVSVFRLTPSGIVNSGAHAVSYDPAFPEILTEDENNWSVVADFRDDEYSPFLISPSIDEVIIRPSEGTTARPKLKKNEKTDYVVVVFWGGQIKVLPFADLTWENLNPASLTKPILHPGSPDP